MTKKEKQFNEWFDEYADGVKVFEEADMKQAYLQGRADLEKENAELKERNRELDTMLTGESLVANGLEEQLTKATKIIKELCGMVRELNKPNVQLTNVDYSLSEAEQFLSGVEK